jgi:hypothetical protein
MPEAGRSLTKIKSRRATADEFALPDRNQKTRGGIT